METCIIEIDRLILVIKIYLYVSKRWTIVYAERSSEVELT